MKRIRLTTGPVTIFGAVFVVAALALLPMRVALGAIGVGEQGLSARAVEGSVWSGTLREAQVGRVALGDLHVAVSPLALLVGRARVALSGKTTDLGRSIDGAIEISRHSFGLSGMTATVPTGNIFAPAPISGLDLDSVDVRFEGGDCVRASGRVKASLDGEIGGVAMGQGMAGEARCDAGALLLPLASPAGAESAVLRLWQDGRYHADLTIRSDDPAAADRLARAGFLRGDKGYVLSIEGRL
ncbi:type II secretion system protein N [Sphingomonas sp. NFR15]|uniref:type II secretion system protein N n=1 Tax=Sphingomonas sp. NFR15 TaxID=1566282 RepID=UPI000885C1B4|nr:type II secretion system protein N [Sphingomonas sp. NFR15]SDA28748.1 general secretion pathway protein N [Sphingomonas sp. NFR15]